MAAGPLSLVISILSLTISAATAFFTFFHRGAVRMTRPTTIYFGPDVKADSANPKVYLRTLLFSTSKRGQIIESLHVSLSRNETIQTFNIWVYGEERLVRGSGLFVGETGVVTNHHFLLPKDGSHFNFSAGIYQLDVFVKLLGRSKRRMLFSDRLEVSQEDAKRMATEKVGLYFDWGPDSSHYLAYVDDKRLQLDKPSPLELLDILMATAKPGNPPPETTVLL